MPTASTPKTATPAASMRKTATPAPSMRKTAIPDASPYNTAVPNASPFKTAIPNASPPNSIIPDVLARKTATLNASVRRPTTPQLINGLYPPPIRPEPLKLDSQGHWGTQSPMKASHPSNTALPTTNALPQRAPTPGLFTSSSNIHVNDAGQSSAQAPPQPLRKDSSTYQMLDRSAMRDAIKSGGSCDIQVRQLIQCKGGLCFLPSLY